METTARTFPRLKKIYKKIFRSKILNSYIHKILNVFVDAWAKMINFQFPKKYNWDWKLEMLSGKYERDTVNIFKKIIKPGMTVIDIGAHVGYYTLKFSKLTGENGRVYAFEADLDNFKLLEKNTKIYKNISLNNVAIADQEGNIDFYKVNDSTGCHSIIPADDSNKISVKATTLDNFIKKHSLEHVDIIKIDIEGGEPLAFIGMQKLFTNSHSLSIVMEFSPTSLKSANINPAEFLQGIKKNGFNIFQILKNGRTKELSINNMHKLDFYQTGYANLLLKKNTGIF